MIKLEKEQIKKIADELDSSFSCYYNKKTGSIVSFIRMEDYLMDEEEEPFSKEIADVEDNIDDYFEFEPMRSRDSFSLMEEFTELVDDIKLKNRLIDILQERKPFKNFKAKIDYSGEYRQKWFDFKNQKYIEWVEEQIEDFNDEFEDDE